MVLPTVPAQESSPEVRLRSLDRARKRRAASQTYGPAHHHHRLSVVNHHFTAFSFPGWQQLRYPSRVRDREGRGERPGGTEREPRAEGTRDALSAPPRPLGGEAEPPSPGLPPPSFSLRLQGRSGAGGKGTGRGGGLGPPPPGTKGPSISRAAEHNKGA